MRKQPYVSPTLHTFGNVLTKINGGGGDYLDECTSGYWPGDEGGDDDEGDGGDDSGNGDGTN